MSVYLGPSRKGGLFKVCMFVFSLLGFQIVQISDNSDRTNSDLPNTV